MIFNYRITMNVGGKNKHASESWTTFSFKETFKEVPIKKNGQIQYYKVNTKNHKKGDIKTRKVYDVQPIYNNIKEAWLAQAKQFETTSVGLQHYTRDCFFVDYDQDIIRDLPKIKQNIYNAGLPEPSIVTLHKSSGHGDIIWLLDKSEIKSTLTKRINDILCSICKADHCFTYWACANPFNTKKCKIIDGTQKLYNINSFKSLINSENDNKSYNRYINDIIQKQLNKVDSNSSPNPSYIDNVLHSYKSIVNHDEIEQEITVENSRNELALQQIRKALFRRMNEKHTNNVSLSENELREIYNAVNEMIRKDHMFEYKEVKASYSSCLKWCKQHWDSNFSFDGNKSAADRFINEREILNKFRNAKRFVIYTLITQNKDVSDLCSRRTYFNIKKLDKHEINKCKLAYESLYDLYMNNELKCTDLLNKYQLLYYFDNGLNDIVDSNISPNPSYIDNVLHSTKNKTVKRHKIQQKTYDIQSFIDFIEDKVNYDIKNMVFGDQMLVIKEFLREHTNYKVNEKGEYYEVN